MITITAPPQEGAKKLKLGRETPSLKPLNELPDEVLIF